jgi:carbon-monoxide dehydrogenase small subunit
MTRDPLQLTVNGRSCSAPADPRSLLVETLREHCDVQGPKVGCLTGDCGACTVRLNGEIIKSCLEIAVAADGADIVTLEGLTQGDGLTSLQESFWNLHGFQCGYCLSGMIFAAEDLLARDPNPTEEAVRQAIAGNLCRCTGYENIVQAVLAAARDTPAD